MNPIDWGSLRSAACARIDHAYAPYSQFRVAAALLSAEGAVYTGVNVENASYGLTLCAERAAVVSAVAHGARAFCALVVVCSGEQPAAPCGACRQVLCEFPPAFEIRCYGRSNGELWTTTDELLPHAFGAANFAARGPA